MSEIQVGEVAETPAPLPAGPRSPLSALRGKREQLEKSLFIDLLVPRWEGLLEDDRVIWVRYGPANPATFTTRMAKREEAHKHAISTGRAGDPEWMTKANADLLVEACLAVYTLPAGEEPPKGDLPSGDYPTFSSPELSADLASESKGTPTTACDTVLALYATSADVLLASNQVLNWSGRVSEETDKDFLAN